MRVVFLGTPEFALPPLRALLDSRYSVCAVITQPDRPAGRGRRLTAPPAKILAASRGIPVHQPLKIRAEENRALFEELAPDFLVVVAYGQILPGWLLELPRIAPVNIHASLLPRYRGAAPVAHAILSGDSATGVTTMWMEETLDTGPVLLQKMVPIPLESTCGELESKLSETGAELLLSTLEGLCNGTLKPRPQVSSQATMAPKITKEMAAIDWRHTAASIHNRVRAFNPWPIAFTEFQGEKLQILRSLPWSDPALGADCEPGRLLRTTTSGIVIGCGRGTAIEILEVQLAGRKRIRGREFANGARLRPGAKVFYASTEDSE